MAKPGGRPDAVPRWSYLDDVHVARGDIGLDLDLLPEAIGDTSSSPLLDQMDIGLGKGDGSILRAETQYIQGKRDQSGSRFSRNWSRPSTASSVM